MNIRKARAADAAAVGKLYTDSWKTTYGGLISGGYLDSLQYSDAAEKWSSFIAEVGSVVLLAEEGDHVAGFAAGRPGGSQACGELYALYVDHAEKGRGIGGKLLSALAAYFGERGMKTIIVWVMSTNVGAVSFYKSRGAVCCGERTHSFGDETVDDICLIWRELSKL